LSWPFATRAGSPSMPTKRALSLVSGCFPDAESLPASSIRPAQRPNLPLRSTISRTATVCTRRPTGPAAPCPTAAAKSDSPPGGPEYAASAANPPVLVQVASVLEGLLHCLLGDLVEGHAANFFLLFGGGSQLQSEVVGNCLALAVRVRRQKIASALAPPASVAHHLPCPARQSASARRSVLQLHAKIVLGQVHDVTHRG